MNFLTKAQTRKYAVYQTHTRRFENGYVVIAEIPKWVNLGIVEATTLLKARKKASKKLGIALELILSRSID